DGSADNLPDTYKIGLYRIVQEALTNCARHSEARTVTIHLASEETRYTVRIEDDGKGFAPKGKARGLGLIGIEERISSMNGKLDIQAAPGQGTKILVSIPLAGVSQKTHENSVS
ncbi:MAG: ATP-binding protein, partial [Bryobacteraceae bacterium]